MIRMILQMSAVTALYVLLTCLLFRYCRDRAMRIRLKVLIGVLYGICSVLSTHFGVNYGHMMLNVRDIGPLAAGLFFSPSSGIIAGLIGGIERYIAGTYFGVGSYTRIACSISTCLAGFLAAWLNIRIYKRRRPAPFFAFFMGAVMEVFHMYAVFITHRNDMTMAFYVVQNCAGPMIIFTAIGMAACAIVINAMSGQEVNPFRPRKREEIPLTSTLQRWLLVTIAVLLAVVFTLSASLRTRSAYQEAEKTIKTSVEDIEVVYQHMKEQFGEEAAAEDLLKNMHIGESGRIYLADKSQAILAGKRQKLTLQGIGLSEDQIGMEDEFFTTNVLGRVSYCYIHHLGDGHTMVATLPITEVMRNRDIQSYETIFAGILLATTIFLVLYSLVQLFLMNNLERVNTSLGKITAGDLTEAVNVRSSKEFASLSDDINRTVDALKGYIEQEKKRMEDELELARSIQHAALPRNFHFPGHDEFDLFALMEPAREVGGDFYDFFFVGQGRIALVVADVSGKGVPASLFMMRSKTAIRTLAESGKAPSEIFSMTNEALCVGNDSSTFVTAWIGILDLTTGKMQCANAGHEYPVIRRAGGKFEIYKDPHAMPLAAMEGMRFREYELQLAAGDAIFVYSDGVPEAIDVAEEQYGTERMVASLNRSDQGEMETLLHEMREDVRVFVGEADQFDDITMLGFHYRGQKES